MDEELAALKTAADREASVYDQMLDCCIRATGSIARENPDFDSVAVRAVSTATMSIQFEQLPRQALLDLLAAALERLTHCTDVSSR